MTNRFGMAMVAATLVIGASAIGVGAGAAGPKIDLKAALADPARPDADKVRDADRKPAELIAFSGVKSGDMVAELAPGGGYFTRLLTVAVGPKGKVYAYNGRPANPAMQQLIDSRPNLVFAQVPGGAIPVPQPVDVVWTTLNYHDFENGKTTDGAMTIAAATNAAAFKALKPGGIYFIVDHAANADAPADVTSTLHRIQPVRVKQEVEAAGFKLEASSPLLAHPADDHSARVMETGVRGKTDQFVLRFRKPKR